MVFVADKSVPVILGPLPGAAPNERRANRLWRAHLNGDLLKAVLQNVKRKIGHTKSYPFLVRPSSPHGQQQWYSQCHMYLLLFIVALL